ncbi:hypothetical protein ASD54_08870 [Rhizobium sp. Root149]|nr:hypothetical protein ASD54_08870 [Rhizobium sp. Root149]
MESLMFNVLRHKFPDKFDANSPIEIGAGWLGVAQDLVMQLAELHPDIRIGAMFRDQHGMLHVDAGVVPTATPGDVPVDDLDILYYIVDNVLDPVADKRLLDNMLHFIGQARLLSAWTCYEDGKPGWLVDAPDGRRPLCAECQRRRGLLRRHEA